MTNTLNRFKSSTNVLVETGLIAAVALAMFVSIPQARAESPNILVGPDLTIGSTGQGVVVLQGLMSELGYLRVPFGIPFGYYGSLTRDAVSRYQRSLNVSPTAGYFGPLTKTAMHADFARHGYLSLLGW